MVQTEGKAKANQTEAKVQPVKVQKEPKPITKPKNTTKARKKQTKVQEYSDEDSDEICFVTTAQDVDSNSNATKHGLRDKNRAAESQEWKKNSIFDDGCGNSDSDNFEEKQRVTNKNAKKKGAQRKPKRNSDAAVNVETVVCLLFLRFEPFFSFLPQKVYVRVVPIHVTSFKKPLSPPKESKLFIFHFDFDHVIDVMLIYTLCIRKLLV